MSRRIEMFKPEYQGARPAGRLTPLEAEAFDALVEPLQRRLYVAMLTLGAMAGERSSRPCSMPEYIHTFADKVGWDTTDALPAPSFRPTPADFDDLLDALQLLEGLSPVFLKVLALRSVGWKFGGFSWKAIGERFGKSPEWASRVHAAVVVLAARRSGLLAQTPKGHAVVVVGVRAGGWRSYLTTAADPRVALHDLKAKSPLELEAAFALWTAGRPEAQRLAKAARQNLLGRVIHGSWHLAPPDDLADLLIEEQTRAGRPWELERLSLPRPRRSVKGGFTELSNETQRKVQQLIDGGER